MDADVDEDDLDGVGVGRAVVGFSDFSVPDVELADVFGVGVGVGAALPDFLAAGALFFSAGAVFGTSRPVGSWRASARKAPLILHIPELSKAATAILTNGLTDISTSLSFQSILIDQSYQVKLPLE